MVLSRHRSDERQCGGYLLDHRGCKIDGTTAQTVPPILVNGSGAPPKPQFLFDPRHVDKVYDFFQETLTLLCTLDISMNLMEESLVMWGSCWRLPIVNALRRTTPTDLK